MVTTTHFISFREKLIETTVTNEVSTAKNWILAIRLAYQEDSTVIISLNSKTNPQDGAKLSTLQLYMHQNQMPHTPTTSYEPKHQLRRMP